MHNPMKINFISTIIAMMLLTGSANCAEDSLSFSRFGKVNLYYAKPQPSNVVLFVSGDGGWNKGVVDMARELVTLDALVVGIDIIHYLGELEKSEETHSYPASDFELLSKFVQQKLGYTNYTTPVLVGYSSGATLVYATLVQAPAHTFKGAISLGFGPDLPLTKPFAKGDGLECRLGPKGKSYIFQLSQTLQVPWIALQGTEDQVVSPSETEKFVQQTKNASIMILPKVGHGFSAPKNWIAQFKAAFESIVQTQPDTGLKIAPGVSDLPLIEVPTNDSSKTALAILITGDGGWVGADKGMAQNLSAHGIPVIGWNSLKYFWQKRTPDQCGKDLERVLNHYLNSWKKEKAVLIGYSMGADVLPFMISRLPEDLRSRIQIVALIGVARVADFEFHFSNWLGRSTQSSEFATPPELQKLKGMNILSFYSEQDKDALGRDLDPSLGKLIVLKGGHRLGDNFTTVTDSILTEVK
ncbi:MAG: prolyl oligopeptidase family serine peptidase [bacterium]|nr:prolyl oligopeptidase family serine peptidase [bacterium]